MPLLQDDKGAVLLDKKTLFGSNLVLFDNKLVENVLVFQSYCLHSAVWLIRVVGVTEVLSH